MTQKILIIDDDEGILSALKLLLKSEGFATLAVTHVDQAITALQYDEFNLVLADLNFSLDTTSGEEGLKLIAALRHLDESIPIVVMTGWGTIEIAVSAMKNGANDFVQKPWDNNRLITIIKNQIKISFMQIESQKLIQQNQLLKEEVYLQKNIIAEAPITKDLVFKLQQIAKSDVSVLLTGENGTGKSMYARYLHDCSHRSAFPFIALNMGAITEGLFESEMFGHLKGAFTDAKSTRIGRFELADRGTLFFDEIGNTPLSQQGKLLRVLEESKFEKVGSSKTQTVDVRVISATNSDLKKSTAEGKFRTDLMYRLNTIQIEIPPLRNRREDILPLTMYFLEKISKKYSQPIPELDKAAQSALLDYKWPGNVRELSHVLERAHILKQHNRIFPEDLGIGVLRDQFSNFPTDKGYEIDLRKITDIESDVIAKRLAYFGGDVLKASESLGLSRSAMYRRIGKVND
jgi:DNA-binding NtrC family response regulator